MAFRLLPGHALRGLAVAVSTSLFLSACSTSPLQQPETDISRNIPLESLETVVETETTSADTPPLALQPLQTQSAGIVTPSLGSQEAISQAEFPVLPLEATDLWAHLRRLYALPEVDNVRVQREVDWYARHPAYLDRVNERATPYMYYITSEIEKRGMPGEIALLPIVESAFKPFAYSHGRAAGIWQFIPGTGRLYGLKQNWWYDGRRDVYASTQAALDYLQRLNNMFNGDWMLALAAYNSGEGTVMRAVERNRKKGKPTNFWALDLPKETRSYVPRLLAIAKVVADPTGHNINLDVLPNTPYFARVETGSQIDLALAAELADISLDELYELNPGFNRWATAPKGPHYLLVPVAKEDGFRERLAALPENERMRWKRHKVAAGETLSHIADKYHISIALLKDSNKIRGNLIRNGQDLLIPIASKSAPTYSLSASQRKQKILNAPKSGRVKLVHTVSAGDNFWDLSRHYNVNVRSLAKWNAMAPGDVLQRGQELVIWVSAKEAGKLPVTQPVTAPASAPVAINNPVMQRINYIVRPGDSLARIAAKFRVRVNDLLRWNTLSKGNYLQPGQRIKLFVDVTRQSS